MRVDPVTELKDIRAIKKLLSGNLRDLMLFILGINTGLRVQDILAFKVKDFDKVKIGERITIKEKKTGKLNVIIINSEIFNAVNNYLNSVEAKPNDYLVKSRKGNNSPLTTFRVTRLVKEWTSQINLTSNYGAHSLRKTWCYIQRTQFGVTWELLSKHLNHSSPSITRRYLGIKEEEVEKVLLHNI